MNPTEIEVTEYNIGFKKHSRSCAVFTEPPECLKDSSGHVDGVLQSTRPVFESVLLIFSPNNWNKWNKIKIDRCDLHIYLYTPGTNNNYTSAPPSGYTQNCPCCRRWCELIKSLWINSDLNDVLSLWKWNCAFEFLDDWIHCKKKKKGGLEEVKGAKNNDEA